MDAFLLTILTVICLTYFAIPITHPFLFVLVIVLVFALVYVIAVVLRLRKAATDSPAAPSEEQATPIEYTVSTLVKGWTRETRTPPEKY
jgi:flagellar biosynthesis/type III secretory pathway M-ring protein FliF/YscJ